MKINLLSLIGVFILISNCSYSQFAGGLDTDFANEGRYVANFGFQDNLEAVAIQSDGKIIVAGTALTEMFSGKLLVTRLNADGSLDNSFAENGVLIVEAYNESYAYEILVLEDNSILIAGASADDMFAFSGYMFKLDETGYIDSSFGEEGEVLTSFIEGDEFIYAAKIDSNGKIVVAGKATNADFNSEPFVARFNADGSVDTSFGENGYATIPVENQDNVFYDLMIDGNDNIIATGHYGLPFTETGQTNLDVLLVKYNTAGSLDTSFGDEGIVKTPISEEYTESGFAIISDSDENIYVSGYTTALDFSFEAAVLGYSSNGTLRGDFATAGVYTFSLNAQNVFNDIALHENTLVMCGTSGGFFFDDRDFLLLRLNLDGSIDNTFGENGYTLTTIATAFDDANAMALQSDGKIVLAGRGNMGTNNDIAVTRHFNGQNVNVEETLLGGFSIYPNPISGGDLSIVSSSERIERCRIFSADGRLVFDQLEPQNALTLRLNIDELPSGFYSIIINDNTTAKLVIRD
ncbi:MAG: T9SS type A sorting domain-containing protein [Flavobacteriales bacterium]|jgi:uncharacterized delta-60 repeat protein